MKAINWKELAGLLATLAVVWLLWDSVLVYPLKILVVFFHEMSHGLAALATGGSIVEMTIVAEEGGSCVTAGGNRFLTLSAGYLGSLVWGGCLLVLARRTRYDRPVLGLLGTALIVVSLFFVRPRFGFGFNFGLLAGAAMLGAAAFLPLRWSEEFLKVVGLTSCLYAVLDLKSDILDGRGNPSDASMLAEQTGLPAWIWGLLWISVAAVGAVGFLLVSCRTQPAGERRPWRSPRKVGA